MGTGAETSKIKATTPRNGWAVESCLRANRNQEIQSIKTQFLASCLHRDEAVVVDINRASRRIRMTGKLVANIFTYASLGEAGLEGVVEAVENFAASGSFEPKSTVFMSFESYLSD